MYSEEEIRKRLVYAIPLWWQDIQEMRNIHDQGAVEEAAYAFQFQRYVDGRSPITADEEKLIKWEVLYNLKPDMNKPLVDRRSFVTAKMRGIGIVTKALLKRTVESFQFGDVEITQKDGRVIITFVSSYGIPSFLDDVKRVVRDLVPAHLEIEYKFLYNTYEDVYMGVGTYDALILSELTYEELLYTELDFSGYIPPEGLEFFDMFDGVNSRGMTLQRTNTRTTGALSAGTTSIPLVLNAFSEGTSVSIYDDAHSETVKINETDGAVIHTTPLQHAYKKGAVVARSTAITGNGAAAFSNWPTYSVTATEVL